MFVRAELWHLIGGFDGDYFAHMEEIDLCWRLRRAGFECWVTPESVVYHLGGGTLAYLNPRKTYLNFRNSLATIYKNTSSVRGVGTLLARQLLDALAGVKFLLAQQGEHTLSIARAHGGFYGRLGRLRAERRGWPVLAKAAGEYHTLHHTGVETLVPVKSSGPSRSILYDFYLRQRRRFGELG